MTLKQRALRVLTKDELLALGKHFELEVNARMAVDQLVRALSSSKRATLDKIAPTLGIDRLKDVCNALDLPTDGRAKQSLVERIIAAVGRANNGDGEAAAPPEDGAASYEHMEEALARPDVGTQPQFKKRRPPKEYRYDSSLSPALDWDRAPARERGEQIIARVLDARSLEEAKAAASELKAMSRPFLNWSGKAERLSFEVPTLPLFVHERLSTKAILETLTGHRREKQQSMFDLFADPQRPIADQVLKAYEYKDKWVNRMILGDSLVVMNSLLQYEGLGGQVQMIYMDPPYGVKFGSNFQPFVRKRDVSHGDDDDMTREPEMVQAYRDTWELGLHSYLTYMRDRLLLARDLLAPSGSIFVQISDENVHHVRELLDEVFGAENFFRLITFKKTAGLGTGGIASVSDYILWYAKDLSRFRPTLVFTRKSLRDDPDYVWVMSPDRAVRRITPHEAESGTLPLGHRLFRHQIFLAAGRTESCVYPLEFQGSTYLPTAGRSWSTNQAGAKRLIEQGRLIKRGSTVNYVRFFDDFSFNPFGSLWDDTVSSSAMDKLYVVQTNTRVIQRCMLMATKPGDLVFDPTCGSGTTAHVAEHWGRRWITCDVSRVPLALARQRLLTATFPWYELKEESRGPAGGFVYKRRQNARAEEVGGIVPHVTLKSIANDEPPAEEVLVDWPEEVKSITRVTGPFAFEATIPTPMADEKKPEAADGSFADRMLEVLRKSPVLRLEGNKTVELKNIRVPAKTLSLSAEAVLAETGRPVAFALGPENGPVSETLVFNAAREAHAKDYQWLYVIGFAIEPNARRLIETLDSIAGVSGTYVQASPDLLMGDLLKNMRSSQIFSVCGLPDIEVRKEKGKYLVELRGMDVFDPVEMKSTSRKGDDVPAGFSTRTTMASPSTSARHSSHALAPGTRSRRPCAPTTTRASSTTSPAACRRRSSRATAGRSPSR